MATKKHDFRNAVLQAAALVVAGAILIVPGAANAGFEWTPPPAPPPAVQQDIGPAVQAVPVPAVDEVPADPAMADLAPIDHVNVNPAPFAPMPMPEINGTPEISRAADVTQPTPPSRVMRRAEAPMIEPVIQQPIPAAPKAEAPQKDEAREYALAEGFGQDIPLALMMQQVVPAGYAYSFDPQINLGMRVSWDGGKPWNVVLKESLAPFHVTSTVSGMTVWLHPATGEEELAASAPVETAQAISARPAAASAAAPREQMVSRLSDIESMEYEAREKEAINAPTAFQPPREAVTDPVKLAEIGSRDSNYNPSYPRREKPREERARMPLMLPSTAPAQQTVQAPAADMAAPVSLTVQPQPSEKIAPPTRIFPADYAAGDRMTESPASTLSAAADEKSGPYDPFQIFFWQSEKEASLKDTLERWAGMAGVRLYWNAGGDYDIPKEIRMHGTFPDAVTAVLGAYGESPDRPFGRLHPNQPNGPAVLIIQSSGSTKTVN